MPTSKHCVRYIGCNLIRCAERPEPIKNNTHKVGRYTL